MKPSENSIACITLIWYEKQNDFKILAAALVQVAKIRKQVLSETLKRRAKS